MDSTWVLEQLTAPPTRAAVWLALSFTVAGTATSLTRLVAPELERFVRIVRWVQVPYFGLILGGLSPRLMGLTVLEWDSRYTLGLIVLVCLLVLLVLIRIRLHTEPDQVDGISFTSQTLSPSLIESCAHEFHWCFLRGAVWELLYISVSTTLSPQYWAVWVAAAISLPGIYVQPSPLSERLLTALVLAATSSLFLVTQSFWLCCFLHMGIRVILLWNEPARQEAV